jgi:glutathione S-transferase
LHRVAQDVQPNTPDATRQTARAKLAARFVELDAVLTTRPYLTGDAFMVTDAYAFTIVNWSNCVGIDLEPYPHLSAFMARVAAWPKVREALEVEQFVAAAA